MLEWFNERSFRRVCLLLFIRFFNDLIVMNVSEMCEQINTNDMDEIKR